MFVRQKSNKIEHNSLIYSIKVVTELRASLRQVQLVVGLDQWMGCPLFKRL